MEKIKYIIILFLFILVGCKTPTKIVEVPIEKVKIEYISSFLKDSLILKDSVYIHDSIYVMLRNDTVYYTKIKEAIKIDYKDRYINKTDTVIKVDSIDRPVYINKYTEVNVLQWWQKLLMWVGGVFIAILTLFLFCKIWY